MYFSLILFFFDFFIYLFRKRKNEMQVRIPCRETGLVKANP